MSFGGFYGGGGGGDARMVAAESPYNHMPTPSLAQPHLLSAPTIPQPLFNSQALSLSIKKPKMEGGFCEMGLMGENYENGLMGRIKEDGSESRSGSDNLEGASGDDQDTTPGNKSRKKKKYHRHTPYQIQELESSFKDNPHPDEKQRLDLGKRLGLESKQVKFWFQNRRTQMKTQLERHENTILKDENNKLRVENIAIKEAMRNPVCNNCGGQAILGDISMEEHHLRIENARLRDELNRISLLANKFLGRPLPSFPPTMSNSSLDLAVGRNGFGGLGPMDSTMQMGLDFGSGVSNALPLLPPSRSAIGMAGVDMTFEKNLFVELALVAMDEMMKLGQIDNPLWFRSMDGEGESLNLDEYARTFPPCIGMKPNGFVSESSRATGMVVVSALTVVETLMDTNRWAEMFPSMIGRSATVDVISGGSGDYRNGVLQLMQVELQVVSPLVPVRQLKFLRFCKQQGEGVWAVVDVSIDATREGSTQHPLLFCRRLPSGCIVQDMPHGYSKVIWIEHSEYDESAVHHLYRQLLRSGLGFGAQKWISALQRQCEFLSSILSSTVPAEDPQVISQSGKRSLAKLAQRMTSNFCFGVCATGHKWEVVQPGSAGEAARLLVRKGANNPGEANGVVLSATTSVWMPVPMQHLFALLQNGELRHHWDVLSSGGPMQQAVRITKGQDHHGNAISLLRANATASSTNQNSVVILQETSYDSSGSLIVSAAIDIPSIQVVSSGGDSSCVILLPSGFAIVPDCVPESGGSNNYNGTFGKEGDSGGRGSGGSILTVGFQILVNDLPSAKITMESVDTVNSLISRTINGIKEALQGNQQGVSVDSQTQ